MTPHQAPRTGEGPAPGEAPEKTSAPPDLHPGERLDRVNDDLLLIQKKSGQLFSTDALLLAGYLRALPGTPAAELGSGSGIVSLLALARNKAARVDAYEIQEAFASLTARNGELNRLSHRLRVFHADVREEAALPADAYGSVFANPPYLTGGGKKNEDAEKTAARHEGFGGVAEFARAAGKMLRTGGYFTAVCRPDRAVDLLFAMRQAGVEPKRLTPVLPFPSAAPCLILVEGKKDARPSLYFTPPFHIREGDGADSGECRFLLETGRFPPVYLQK